MSSAICFLLLIQLKHFYVDFINQSISEIEKKGIYGNWVGMWHSIKHGIFTSLCSIVALDFDYYYLTFSCILGIIDFVIHYHIDWLKSNLSSSNPQNKSFWFWLGADQMAHQITYIFLAILII